MILTVIYNFKKFSSGKSEEIFEDDETFFGR